ncbi:MAG: hypothetical protein K8R74_13565 [Bacteroidales bacterium]|nr:hypothetical protein [Bacteroidales bacterium]
MTKTKIFNISPIILFVVGLPVIIIWLANIHPEEINKTEAAPIESNLASRESITFILGEDRELNNQFYAEAEKYYRNNPKDRTEHIITTCRTMEEVRDYLADHAPANKQTWGLVNLVSHGNQWIGLSVRLTQGGKRTSATNINKMLKEGLFKPLPSGIIDSNSNFYVHGCSVGKDTALLKSIAELFKSEKKRPMVHASEYFEYFCSKRINPGRIDSERHLYKAHYAFYKKGYRQGDIRLSRQFANRYPKAGVHWRDALTREVPRWHGDTYNYTFDIPVKWIVLYPEWDSIPNITTEEDKLNWLNAQSDLMKIINKTEIPLNKFSWAFKKIRYPLDDGTLMPGIRVRGYSTVLCVLTKK